jgi:sugar-specific transcriptional regulator TrmB
MRKTIIAVICGALIGIILTVTLSHLNVVNLSAKEYAYIDMERVINEVNDRLAKQNVEGEQLTSKLKQAKEKFSAFTQGYSKKNNAIIFSSVKVIAGAKDITSTAIHEIARGLE